MAKYEGPIEVGMTFHNGKGRRVRVAEKITVRGLPSLVLDPLNKGGKTTTKDVDYFRWDFQPEADDQPVDHEWSVDHRPTGPDGVYVDENDVYVRLGGVSFWKSFLHDREGRDRVVASAGQLPIFVLRTDLRRTNPYRWERSSGA